ncbi:deoxyribose-phosphate aldolase (plasmid) [Chloroflexota bacterium]|nr:deoxyribose-phosphate aldolase [Chloroflexota bacterium]
MDIVQEIMKMVDHSLLGPGLTDKQLKEGCAVAAKYHTASVCVKPYHVRQAAEYLKGTDVAVGAVIGFPHGNSTTAIKVAEAKQVLADGAVEVDMVVNIGKVLSEDWQYVSQEIKTLADLAHLNGAILKVIFENDLLPEDRFKIKLCEICSEAGADFVKTSTGYNYVKGADGKYSYRGATLHDLQLMRDHAAPEVQVKAAGKSGTLDAVIKIREIGVTRTGTAQTAQLFDEAVAKFRS